MARPTWDQYFLKITHEVTQRSTCLRRQVGAIIVKDKRILTTGYNDTPRGLRNCGDGGCQRCASNVPSGQALDTCLCIHAEQNAIVNAAYHGVQIQGATLYTTFSPCLTCAKMIANGGLLRVVFAGEYPDQLAMNVLQDSKIECVKASID